MTHKPVEYRITYGGADRVCSPGSLPTAERPQEKLLRYGSGALADYELLVVLLGIEPEQAQVLASEDLRTLLDRVGETALTPKRKAQAQAAVELGRRVTARHGPTCSSPEEAYALLSGLGDERKEHFVALLLDARRRVISKELISIGTLTSSLVHPRELFLPAITASAAAIVVAHNHPSGDPEPSPEDLALTRRLRQAGEIVGIELLDHVIVAGGRYVSLKQRGIL